LAFFYPIKTGLSLNKPLDPQAIVFFLVLHLGQYLVLPSRNIKKKVKKTIRPISLLPNT